jgi:hypothetical protein
MTTQGTMLQIDWLKKATGLNSQHKFQNLLLQDIEFIWRKIFTKWENKWKTSKKADDSAILTKNYS